MGSQMLHLLPPETKPICLEYNHLGEVMSMNTALLGVGQYRFTINSKEQAESAKALLRQLWEEATRIAG